MRLGQGQGIPHSGRDDVIWCGDWPKDPGDDEILVAAHAQQRVLVTLDKDFGELAVLHKKQHSGIIRLVGFSAQMQAGICLQVLAAHGNELVAGAIVTAERGRMRIRSPQE